MEPEIDMGELISSVLGGQEQGGPAQERIVRALREREAFGELGAAGGTAIQQAAAPILQGARGQLKDQADSREMILKRALWSQGRTPDPMADEADLSRAEALGLKREWVGGLTKRQLQGITGAQAQRLAADADRERRAKTPEAIAAAADEKAAKVLERASKQATVAEKQAAMRAGPAKNEMELRKEWIGQAPYKNAQASIEQFQKVETSSENAAGDLSLIFSYMKMLDPGSAVREGEFANAQNAAGIPDRLVAAYNNALSGERLSPEARKRFRDEARAVLMSTLDSYEQNAKFYRDMAVSNGFNPDNVVPPMKPLSGKGAGVKARKFNPATGKVE